MPLRSRLVRIGRAALALVVASCVDSPSLTSPRATLGLGGRETGIDITMTPQRDTLRVGDTVQFSGSGIDRKGRLILPGQVVWSSADVGIVQISRGGLAVAGPGTGTVRISATTETGKGLVNVIVVARPEAPPPPPPETPPPPTPPAPPPLGPSDVTFTVNTGATFEISRFIYGGNFLEDPAVWGGATPPTEMTLNRMGGNRLSAYNWENNYSNAGADFNFQNDQYLSSSTTPGQAVRSRANASFARNQAFMATIPMLGHVSADACNCNVGTSDADRANRLATRFRISQPFKGSAFSLTPNANDGFVYQDEFVNWFESAFPGRSSNPTAPVFYSLDNEPDIWHATHREIQSDSGDNPNRRRLQTYQGLSQTSAEYARAVKSVSPNALVFGPAVATYAGLVTAGRYPSPDPQFGNQNFFDVYLAQMRAAEARYGRRLLDVLDTHWYPAAGTPNGEINNDYATQDDAMAQARMQAPRSLWDPTYNENSWVNSVTGGPIRLIPRLRDQIAQHYPATRIAITEYYYGRAGDISGGIAQADVLGIFGREGVYAATFWPQAGIWAAPYGGDGRRAYAYAFGAFRMFRNYDGAGGRFGDTGLRTTTSDANVSSVYASRDPNGNIVLIAINKASTAKVVNITLQGAGGLTAARTWVMSAASSTPVRGADVPMTGGNALAYSMPATSVTTLLLVP
jgi:hypothetical protein